MTLTNCIISGNSALTGGGIYNYLQNSPALANCTFVGNSATTGSGLACFSSGQTDASTILLTGCIFRDYGDEISNEGPSIVEVTYSDVQGGWPGEGNIDADPLFADAGRWVDANDPNAVWVDGDYHLKSQAGRWNSSTESWVMDDVTSPCIDAGDPNSPVGDEPEPNGGRINMGAYGGTAEASKSPPEGPIVYIQWLGHSSVKLWAEDCIVYVDPQRLSISPHDATLVCVTHTHSDHYSPADIARVSNDQTQFVGPPDVVQQYGRGRTIAPGQVIESYCARLTAVPAYNTNKSNHPKANNWVGYIVELGGKRIYVAGDTDLIEEMKSLGKINVAFLPAGGTYTMNAVEAAEATQYIKPDLAIPYHWGQNVGTIADAQTFAKLARCAVKIMTVGETISSDEWPVYSPLIAHWKLDETADSLAQDSAGDFDGTLHGGPIWQPAGGKKAGALQLDGQDDYVSTPFVSNPADGAFSVDQRRRSGPSRHLPNRRRRGNLAKCRLVSGEAHDRPGASSFRADGDAAFEIGCYHH
jgi:L-ascorbate metabolism protein UlaG (beta-lactamase superfamily)